MRTEYYAESSEASGDKNMAKITLAVAGLERSIVPSNGPV
jgi:hypothetical protein